MTIVFFVLSLMRGWVAYNLYRPNRARKYLSVVSFLFGWIIGETVPHVIFFQVLVTGLFGMMGAISGFWGNLGLLITILSWVAMLNHYGRSFGAKEQVERALVKGLGSDYRTDIAPELRGYFSETLPVASLARPWVVDRVDVLRIKNIKYDQADGMNLKLDIYRHRGQPQNCPVVLQIHGGGWTYRMGSKNEQARPLMNHLASRGWVCVSVDYRLSPRATFPDHIVDCKKSLAWVKENIQKWGGNPDFVIVTGGSAGGHLSSLLALTANEPQFQPGFEHVDTRVQGCVPFYGVYDFSDSYGLQPHPLLYQLVSGSVMKKSKKTYPAAYEKASPMFQVHDEAPPFFIIQGDSDTLVSVPEARKFAELLGAKSRRPVAYAEIAGAQHAFDIFPSVRSEYVKLGIERFVNYLYNNYLTEESRDFSGTVLSKNSAG